MNNEHPITPPPELIQQWWDRGLKKGHWSYIAKEAARWGADQELEACCELVSDTLYLPTTAHELRAARRPKPPTLKEQALGLLNEGPVSDLLDHEVATIRRALEQLND